jgi:hypothetical protein
MVLNNCQEKTIEDGVNWFNKSSEQIFEIDGEAGTGKSVVISEITRRLGLQPYQCMPMAYTGQAGSTMNLKAGSSMGLQSSSNMTAKSGGQMKMTAPVINLN